MDRALLDRLAQDRAAKRPVVVATFLDTGEQRLLYLQGKENTQGLDHAIAEAARAAIVADKPRTIDSAQGKVFLNVFNPPLRLILVGAVHIAQALGPMAQLGGFEVAIIDPRGAFATPERFPGISLHDGWPDEAMAALKPDLRTAVVTLTHDPKLDDPALAAALRSDAFYIGALGSKKTHAARLGRLSEMGFPEHEHARIRGPLGLAIGAVSPAEIAVSALAEIIQTLRRADAA